MLRKSIGDGLGVASRCSTIRPSPFTRSTSINVRPCVEESVTDDTGEVVQGGQLEVFCSQCRLEVLDDLLPADDAAFGLTFGERGETRGLASGVSGVERGGAFVVPCVHRGPEAFAELCQFLG